MLYKTGKSNVGADAMSRWAYPACKSFNDCSTHGGVEDAALVKQMDGEEAAEYWHDVDPAEVRQIALADSVFARDWRSAYSTSSQWKSTWQDCHTAGATWPTGVQLRGDQKQFMYLEGKLCVPEDLLVELVHQWHSEVLGHCGVEKMMLDMKPKFVAKRLAEVVSDVKKGCQVCQAAEKPNWRDVQWRSTPVPDQPMMDIALDVVHLGEDKTWDGRVVDSCLVVVDRHSGWVDAYPVAKKGLTAKSTALLMYHRWLSTFGLPRTICSDLGAQFKAAWWRTFCALQGVHHARAVSYHSRSNGRAERACGQVLDKLRKLHAAGKCRWTEALPRALQLLHSVPGPGGVSPYTALFGRDRTVGYLPLPEHQLCEDAVEFVERKAKLDKELSEVLNKVHKESEKIDAVDPVYHPGQVVSVLRPRKKGMAKMDTWWMGPCTVEQRLGATTYMIKTGPNSQREVHASQLRPHHADAMGCSWPLYHTSSLEDRQVEVDEFDVERVVSHKLSKSGDLLFLVKWEGCPDEENTWESATSFLPQYCRPWVDYCKKHNLKVDVLRFLKN